MKIMIMMVIGLLGLSGCATITDLSRTNAEELLPRPTTQVQHGDYGVPDGFLCDKLRQSWAKTTPSEVQLFERARYCAMIEDDTDLVDINNVDNVKSPRKHLARFVRHGVELADAHCEVFLDAMEGRRVLTEFNLSNFNILVGAATLAMAKLGNHPQSLFNLATGATAANAFADNYKANFLLTGTMHQLRVAVKDYRTKIIESSDLADPARYTSFVAAQGDLREYASVCSHKGLVHIVNTKLADTKFEVVSHDKPDGERIVRLLLDRAKQRDSAIKKAAFGSGEFELIYELARLEKVTRIELMKTLVKEQNKLLKEKLPGVWQVVLALDLHTDDPPLIGDIKRAGELLGYPQGASETQRQQIAAMITAPPPNTPPADSPKSAPLEISAVPAGQMKRKRVSSATINIRGVARDK